MILHSEVGSVHVFETRLSVFSFTNYSVCIAIFSPSHHYFFGQGRKGQGKWNIDCPPRSNKEKQGGRFTSVSRLPRGQGEAKSRKLSLTPFQGREGSFTSGFSRGEPEGRVDRWVPPSFKRGQARRHRPLCSRFPALPPFHPKILWF